MLGFNFGGKPDNVEPAKETKRYVVPEDRAIGRPHMMGWLELLGEDEELMGGAKNEKEKEEKFEADEWVEVEK